jgi:hypothetical protein
MDVGSVVDLIFAKITRGKISSTRRDLTRRKLLIQCCNVMAQERVSTWTAACEQSLTDFWLQGKRKQDRRTASTSKKTMKGASSMKAMKTVKTMKVMNVKRRTVMKAMKAMKTMKAMRVTIGLVLDSLSTWHRSRGVDAILEGHICRPAVAERRQVFERLLARIQRGDQPCLVGQTGLNAAHSSVLLLEHLVSAHRLVTFQVEGGPGTQNYKLFRSAETFLAHRYAGKSQVVWGDSKQTIKAATVPRKASPGTAMPVFDCIYIDGAHSYVGALSDIVCFHAAARPNAWCIMDDVWPRKRHSSLKQWERGPTLAWREAIRRGIVTIAGASSGLVWGRFSRP